MYINIVFIGYMCAVFTGLTNLVILMISFITGTFLINSGSKRLLLFCVSSFLFVLLYFVFYYRENVWEIFELSLPWRLIDYLLNALLYFSWVSFICHYGENSKDKKTSLIVWIAGALAGLWIILGWYMTALHMDNYYRIIGEGFARTLPKIELALIFTLVLIIIFSLLNIRKTDIRPFAKSHLLITGFALVVLALIQSAVNYKLYLGNFDVSAWEFRIFDPMGPIFIIINISATIFILKARIISPKMFFMETGKLLESGLDEPCALIKAVAQEYDLTRRESELIALVYEGYSNSEIARELNISTNTVKTHLKNIFSKLCVSSRIEMIHLIISTK